MNDQKALVGATAGTICLILGVVAVLVSEPLLGLLAGLIGAGTGVVAWMVGDGADRTETEAQMLRVELAEAQRRANEREREVASELEEARSLVVPASGSTDALTDPETGLFSESYFMVALEARIAAARRHLRPIAVVLLDVVQGLSDGATRPADAGVVADGVRGTLRDADTACRLADGRYALLLEDTPENGAIWTIERIRRTLVSTMPDQTLWAGVACYPAHAFGTDEILRRADEALTSAQEWHQDRIEVATAAAD
ncbi:MAG: diguanylate cyclase [Actinomycetia bacterium]|nr:diguanylate cyclase [Actinomycetes bacterium]